MGRPGWVLPPAEIVTGERLQALAEAILIPRLVTRRHRSAPTTSPNALVFDEHRSIGGEHLERLSRARSLSIYSNTLALFKEHVWPKLAGTGYVLISNNADDPVDAEQVPWIEEAGDKLGHWFAQNVTVEHPKLSPLPIGLANAMWPHGDVDALCAVMTNAEPTERQPLLHARFGLDTHPDRLRAWDAVTRAFPEPAATAGERRPFPAYLRDLARHRFCACPRGNGVDTHRFWECQYLGVIPVVERSAHTEIWARRGLPMVALDDWSDLSPDRLEHERRAVSSEPPPVLRLSHHAQLIRGA
jgi:hypothetical protein